MIYMEIWKKKNNPMNLFVHFVGIENVVVKIIWVKK